MSPFDEDADSVLKRTGAAETDSDEIIQVNVEYKDSAIKGGWFFQQIIKLKKRWLQDVKTLYPKYAPHLDIDPYMNITNWTVETTLRKLYDGEKGEIEIDNSEKISEITFTVTLKYKGGYIERMIPVTYNAASDKLHYDHSLLLNIGRQRKINLVKVSREYLADICRMVMEKNPKLQTMFEEIAEANFSDNIEDEIKIAVKWLNVNFGYKEEETNNVIRNLIGQNEDIVSRHQMISFVLTEKAART
ncbi:MAG: hypothetical protein HYU38_07195 [Candidatus Tectomicrobia bacterium]|nr:hypothetical protein [Candidatus Tectomicrobia bacterium]